MVEFKEGLSHHLEKDLSAFANASGGTIYLGISDKGTIHPLSLTHRLKSQLQSTARNCDPPIDITIRPIEDIVAVEVSESLNKPVRASDGFYLRIGASSQKLTRDEIFAFAVQETKIMFDRQLYVKEKAESILATRQVEWFRQKARLEMDLDNLQLLENISCLQRQNQNHYLTHAGILLFGANPQKMFPQATVTLIVLEDLSTIREQKILKGTLFQQIEIAFQFLKDHLKSKPEIQSLERKDVLEIPEFVLRELLVNAIIHRDYFETSSDVVIKIFPTWIEFSNPGPISKRITLDQLWGKSYRRNPMIADVFFHANYIERAGTGLLRVQKTLEHLNLPSLKIAEEGPFFIATLPRPNFDLLSQKLGERQRKLIGLSNTFFPFSTLDYAKQFSISERMARLDIKNLIEAGVIIPQREGRYVRYVKK
ncbi:MAG: putative DNA binding domain-containing protein [Chlamydiae bacterium]|nr:putative DNA binding domain-containing protein [Chlamydiota bacterium]MBI3277603.1 putative DNA binding domain-containing protein [Chlamydiota bacterium]